YQRSGEEGADGGPQLGEGAGAVAQRVLDAGAQLAERLVVLGDEEERVVAEAAAAARLAGDDAVTAALGDGADVAVGGRQRGGADVVGGAAVVGQRRQLGKQAGVVGRVVAVPAGVARRVDAGAAVERRHDEAAVLTEHPVMEVAGEFGGLLAGVVGEGLAVLLDVGRVGPGREVAQVEAEVAEDFEDFLALLAGARADDEDGWHGGSSGGETVVIGGRAALQRTVPRLPENAQTPRCGMVS